MTRAQLPTVPQLRELYGNGPVDAEQFLGPYGKPRCTAPFPMAEAVTRVRALMVEHTTLEVAQKRKADADLAEQEARGREDAVRTANYERVNAALRKAALTPYEDLCSVEKAVMNVNIEEQFPAQPLSDEAVEAAVARLTAYMTKVCEPPLSSSLERCSVFLATVVCGRRQRPCAVTMRCRFRLPNWKKPKAIWTLSPPP